MNSRGSINYPQAQLVAGALRRNSLMLDGAVGLEGIIGGMEFLGGIVRYSIAVGPTRAGGRTPSTRHAAYGVGETVAVHLDAERIIGLKG